MANFLVYRSPWAVLGLPAARFGLPRHTQHRLHLLCSGQIPVSLYLTKKISARSVCFVQSSRIIRLSNDQTLGTWLGVGPTRSLCYYTTLTFGLAGNQRGRPGPSEETLVESTDVPLCAWKPDKKRRLETVDQNHTEVRLSDWRYSKAKK